MRSGTCRISCIHNFEGQLRSNNSCNVTAGFWLVSDCRRSEILSMSLIDPFRPVTTGSYPASDWLTKDASSRGRSNGLLGVGPRA